jgi:Uncharacterized protein conserved in bacteria
MKSRTFSLHVAADRDTVFAFLASLENLSLWAVESLGELTRDRSGARANTPLGRRHVALCADERTGVIDLLLGEKPDEMTLHPLRVISRPHGALLTMTLVQAPDEPDEWFERAEASWLADFRGLKERFGGGGVDASIGERAAFYPGIVSGKFVETWNFYCTHLGFRTVAECGVYVQLSHPSGAQIAVLQHELDGPASELINATDGRGFWLNLDVADADAEFARLSEAGLEIVAPPENKPWGDRMFVVRDPNGVLIALSQRLPAAEPLSTYPAAS